MSPVRARDRQRVGAGHDGDERHVGGAGGVELDRMHAHRPDLDVVDDDLVDPDRPEEVAARQRQLGRAVRHDVDPVVGARLQRVGRLGDRLARRQRQRRAGPPGCRAPAARRSRSRARPAAPPAPPPAAPPRRRAPPPRRSIAFIVFLPPLSFDRDHAPGLLADRHRLDDLVGLDVDDRDVVGVAVGGVEELPVRREAELPDPLADQQVVLDLEASRRRPPPPGSPARARRRPCCRPPSPAARPAAAPRAARPAPRS